MAGDSARVEAVAQRGEVFPGVEPCSPVAIGVEQVGNEDVVGVGGGADEAAGVGGQEALGRAQGAERGELGNGPDDCRHEFNAIGTEVGMTAGGGEADSGTDTEKQGSPGTWVEQEWDVGVAGSGGGRCGSAHGEAVVDGERAMPIGPGPDGDGIRGGAFGADEGCAGRLLEQAEVRSGGQDAGDGGEGKRLEEQATAGLDAESKAGEAGDQQQPGGAFVQGGEEDRAPDDGCEGGGEGVDADGLAGGGSVLERGFQLGGEPGTADDRDGQQHECDEGAFGDQRCGEAVTDPGPEESQPGEGEGDGPRGAARRDGGDEGQSMEAWAAPAAPDGGTHRGSGEPDSQDESLGVDRTAECGGEQSDHQYFGAESDEATHGETDPRPARWGGDCRVRWGFRGRGMVWEIPSKSGREGQYGGQSVEARCGQGGAAEPERRLQEEECQAGSEDGPRRVPGVELTGATVPTGLEERPFQRSERGPHGNRGRQERHDRGDARAGREGEGGRLGSGPRGQGTSDEIEERNRNEGPEGDDRFERARPTGAGRGAVDGRSEDECSQRESGKEHREDGEGCWQFVTQMHGEPPGPVQLEHQRTHAGQRGGKDQTTRGTHSLTGTLTGRVGDEQREMQSVVSQGYRLLPGPFGGDSCAIQGMRADRPAPESMETTPPQAMDGDSATLAGLTHALSAVGRGEEQAPERLLPMVYAELRRLAASKMSGEPPNQTLQPTALVHEVWLRIAVSKDIVWNGRNHFFSVASDAMRRILIERARRRRAVKRGGGWERLDLDHVDVASETQTDTLLAVDEALEKLMRTDPKCGELVKLRFFGGLTLEEAGEVLGFSHRTAKRYWAFARVWLYNEIVRQEGGPR